VNQGEPIAETPARPIFLRARWHWLAMLNYEVDPSVLAVRLPEGTELDAFEGRHYVSMVGFRFLQTRVKGLAIPFHQDFDEVNLRFYVRRKGPEGWRRGVVFVKELVPRRAVALIARWVYGENYRAVPMRHEIESPVGTGAGRVSYEWQHAGAWHGLHLQIAGAPAPAPLASEARFITEHYWGYAGAPGRKTMEYAVEHPCWRVWHATDARFACDVGSLYGEAFVESLSAPPTSAFVADGSAVIVRAGTRLRT
jgi:uncharacterized protein YqjF (DUF2071 family)